MSDVTPRFYLKAETDAVHERLHGHAALAPLAGGAALTPDAYARVLRLFEGFYGAAEPVFANGPAEEERFDGEIRPLPALAADLADLAADGAAVPGSVPFHLPPGAPAPCFSAYAGYLYMKQGATLGGRLIGKTLAQKEWFDPARHGRYFSSYGAETGARWRAFETWLSAHDERLNLGESGAAARYYFRALERCCDLVSDGQNLKSE